MFMLNGFIFINGAASRIQPGITVSSWDESCKLMESLKKSHSDISGYLYTLIEVGE